MVQVGFHSDGEREPSRSPTGRYLLVGAGGFGREVLGRVVRHFEAEDDGLPALTTVVLLDASTLPLTIDEGGDRREINRALKQAEVKASLKDKLFDGVEKCAAMLPMGQMPPDVSDVIHAVVVGDLAEAEGSALVPHVVDELRHVMANRSNTLQGALRISPRLDDDHARVFGTLRELAARFQEADVGADTEAVRSRRSFFDRCFLLGKVNNKGELRERDQPKIVARFLTRFCCADLAGIHEPVGDFTGDERSRLATCGLSSAFMPREELAVYCRRRWCEDVCRVLSTAGTASGSEDEDYDRQAWDRLPIPAVGEIHKLLEEVWITHRRGRSDFRSPNIRTLKPAALAKAFAQEWRKSRERIAGLTAKLDTTAPLQSWRDSIAARLDGLVEQHLGGIHEAQRRLTSIHATLLGRINESRSKAVEDDELVGELVNEVDEHLRSAETSLEIDPSVFRRPPWYDLFGHWERLMAKRRAMDDIAAWKAEAVQCIDVCCTALAQDAISTATLKSFEASADMVDAELARLGRLQAELGQAPNATKPADRVREPTVVDHCVLPGAKQDIFYAHWLAKPVGEVAAQLLSSRNLLAGYRELTAQVLAERLETAVGLRIAAIHKMSLRELLDAAGLTPDYLKLGPWLTHGLWDYAEPLTPLRDLPDSQSGRFRAEFAALQVPGLASLAEIPHPWPYSSNPPLVVENADCSVHLCRVFQGFAFDALQGLGLWREAYQAADDRCRFHTVEDPDDLPSLAE